MLDVLQNESLATRSLQMHFFHSSSIGSGGGVGDGERVRLEDLGWILWVADQVELHGS